MSRLTTAMLGDVHLQARNGFYWAVALLLGCFAVLVSSLPDLEWRSFLPALVFGNLVVATFYFVGAMVLLEKSEGTLFVQLVSPLTVREYLLSKLVTLSMLSIVETIAIVALVQPGPIAWVPFLCGVGAASVLYCLAGFLVVIRYDSINEYLFPTILYVTVLLLPLLDSLGLWRSPLMRLHPLDPAMRLIAAGFESATVGASVLGAMASVGWIIVALEMSRRSFRRFVIAPAGGI